MCNGRRVTTLRAGDVPLHRTSPSPLLWRKALTPMCRYMIQSAYIESMGDITLSEEFRCRLWR